MDIHCPTWADSHTTLSHHQQASPGWCDSFNFILPLFFTFCSVISRDGRITSQTAYGRYWFIYNFTPILHSTTHTHQLTTFCPSLFYKYSCFLKLGFCDFLLHRHTFNWLPAFSFLLVFSQAVSMLAVLLELERWIRWSGHTSQGCVGGCRVRITALQDSPHFFWTVMYFISCKQ